MTRVLIVDDQPENRYLLQALVRGFGYDPVVAGNGAEALEAARRDPPGIVISDILMPVMDGFTLCSEWMKDERLRLVPFVFYTATYTGSKDVELAKKLGAARFLVKPIEPEDFIGVVRQVLREQEDGRLVVPPIPVEEETVKLDLYNEVLIRKLEKKTLDLEKIRKEQEQEIARRESVEKALRESEEKVRQILDSTAEGICGLDLEGNCTFCNPAALEILGFHDEKDLVGRNMHEIIHYKKTDGTPFSKEECAILDAMEKGEKIHFDNEIRWRADGRSFPVEYWVHPITREGKAVGAVFTFVDITERVNVESQLRQAQKMEAVGRLAGGVAHDFNNMLNVILGYSEMALARLDPGSPLALDLNEVRKAGLRSAELTRRLLAFSRKQITVPTIMNLDKAIADEVEMLRRLVGEDLRIEFVSSGDPWNIRMDPSQVSHILANLAVNARDAIAGVGTVTLETSNTMLDKAYCQEHDYATPGEYVMLAFSDTGMGMDAATLERVFEPFFTTKEVGKGTGLGLAMVYGIVKQNGGIVTVYSELGIGTTFRIYFPRVREAAGEAVETSKEAVPTGTETVLLVEDEEQILSLAARILEGQGYRVLSARLPEDACRLAERHDGKIDLLLTDVVMPEMNGKELQERIAALLPGIRTVFMSGYADDAIVHCGVLDDGVAFVQKPFTARSLAVKVRVVLDA